MADSQKSNDTASAEAAHEPPASGTPASPERTVLGTARALVLAWAAVALLHGALAALLIPLGRASFGVSLQHHFFAAGQALALGGAFALSAFAWERFGPFRDAPGRRAWATRGTRAVVAAALGGLLLADDLLGAVGVLPGSAALWSIAAGALVAQSVPLAWEVGGRSARNWWRFAAAGVALVLLASNDFVLLTGYSGIHLALAAMGATLLAASLSAVRIPARLASRPIGRAVYGAVAAVSIAALAIPMKNDVVLRLLTRPGAVMAPYVARVHQGLRRSTGGLASASEWFRSRENAPPIEASEPPLVPRKNAVVFLITVDALRADVLATNRHAARLPTLDKLRGTSTVFRQARSTAPSTTPSLAALMSGKYYSQLHWVDGKVSGKTRPFLHEDKTPRFPELLAKAGVKTVNAVSTTGLRGSFGVVRGFEKEFDDGRSAEDLVDKALEQLEASADEPFLMYMHLLEPHEPYVGKGKTPFERYIGEIATVDGQLARLFDLLAKPRYSDRAVVILSADHGEAFGEHGKRFHAVSVYEELLRVPMFIRMPDRKHRDVDVPVSLIDLGPTVLDLFGLPTPGHFMGQSLVPFLRGQTPALTRPIVADSGRRMQSLIFPDNMKVIRDLRRGTSELYDLNDDPKELDNLADTQPDLLPSRLGVLEAFFDAQTFRRQGYVVPYRE